MENVGKVNKKSDSGLIKKNQKKSLHNCNELPSG